MAVLDHLPGVNVTIHVKSGPLHEYRDSDTPEDARPSSQYIEAKTSQHFKIKVFTPPSLIQGEGFAYFIFVDGRVSCRMLVPTEVCVGSGNSWESKGWQVDLHTRQVQQYKFTNLGTVEETIMASVPKEEAEDLGLIKVEVYEIASSTAAQVAPNRVPAPTPFESVSEKDAKGKALSHTVGFGPKVTEKTYGLAHAQLTSSEPIGTFKFHYRSLNALKAEHIIPRTSPLLPYGMQGVTNHAADQIGIKQEEREETPHPFKVARLSRKMGRMNLGSEEMMRTSAAEEALVERETEPGAWPSLKRKLRE